MNMDGKDFRIKHLQEKPAIADVRNIVTHVLEMVLPEQALRRYVSFNQKTNHLMIAKKKYNLNSFERIIVVGGGKAAKRTGVELVQILGNKITAGVLNVYRDQAEEPISEKIKLFAADHPIPNEEGLKGARQMIELLKNADAKTMIIALISGGGSSLMAIPAGEISIGDYQDISRILMTVPATIDEINAVRKHIDLLKGGRMRRYASKAGAFISLVLSDVPVTKTGIVDDTSVISSGPTVGDDSTFETAKQVLTGYNIWDKTPATVRKYIQDNIGIKENETLPKNSPLLNADKSQYVIIANNDQAMEAAGEKARELGYKVNLIGWKTGNTADKIKAEVIREIENIFEIINPHLMDKDRITFASFSTDGIDGHSDLAGAIADMDTIQEAHNRGLDENCFTAAYDSATFFKKLELEIETGPTGTNVADVTIVLINNTDNPQRKVAFIFGGEATVSIALPDGKKPGNGGRNTHLVLLAAEKLNQLSASSQ
jgi:glycerate-2-kinase